MEAHAEELRFLTALIPEARPLREALERSGLSKETFLGLLDDEEFQKLAARKVEGYVRFLYLTIVARICQELAKDPMRATTAMLRLIAERFDPKFKPTTQHVHTLQLPDFRGMSRDELLRLRSELALPKPKPLEVRHDDRRVG